VDTQPDPDIQVAGYRIEARLGRGGMGEVYRAVQLDLGRRVALKVLSPELAADDGFRRRFLRESRIAASIDHPNVIPIYQAGEDNGLLYIAMRYVEGSDLATLLEREGRLAPARTLAILAQVAGALDAAHDRGLVHRDVKPANILLATAAAGATPHCYLCDFGLIKQTDAAKEFSALTAVDQFVGTVPYVAPEQIEGRQIDGRTDVYSLGCVLFQCLTGSLPFEGSNDVEVVFAHLRGSPPPLSTRAPGLPPSLDAVLARALAKSKDDRHPTCAALIAATAEHLSAVAPRPHPAVDDETRSMVIPPPPVAAPPPGPGAPPAPAPPLARPADRAVDARSASGPPVGERSGPGESEPAAVHRSGAGPVDHRGGAGPVGHGGGGRPAVVYRGDRRGRRWLVALAVVVLPVVAYVAAVEVFGGAREPRVGAAPDQAGVAAGPATTANPAATRRTATTGAARCPGGWTRPAVGTATRTAPLTAIRAHEGWTGRFLVEEMRQFSGEDGLDRWYVKARQETDPSLRGRWLVQEDEEGGHRVVASAAFDSTGYRARDWRTAPGQRALPAGLAGCLANT
jgi:serine/threonine protein kinase